MSSKKPQNISQNYSFDSGKRYNSFTGYFQKRYGTRLQKVVIDAGFTCPNRDGLVGFGGCTFCDNAAFHPGYSTPSKSIKQQIDEGIEFHEVRYRRAGGYLAYFQPYSNTYAPVERLKEIYSQAIDDSRISGIVIGTRPDCIDSQKLDLLAEFAKRKIVIVEYGIESCYDKTLKRINRGHTFADSVAAIEQTAQRGLQTAAHIIMGLPGETKEEMLATAGILSAIPITSLKIHQLQILKGTAMEKEFAQKREDFVTFTLDEYLDFITCFIERLSPDIYIERIAGEVPPRFVNSTPWGLIRNFEIQHKLDDFLEKRETYQGKLYLKP